MKLTSKEQKFANILAKGIVIILAIFAYALRLLFTTLYRLKRYLFRLAIIIFIFYNGMTVLHLYANAPRANAVLDGTKPFITKTDYTVKEIVLSMGRYEFGENQLYSLEKLIFNESGFDPTAVNPNGGACGLFQALPCSKMASMDLEDQISFGFNYIKNRYGTPNNAWAFWQAHHWY